MTTAEPGNGRVKDGTRDLVVLGIGNPLLSDDGAGIHALGAIGRAGTLPPGVRLVDGGTVGLQLLASVAGCDGLMVLDAVNVGGEPGEVVRLDLADGLGAMKPRTAHDLGLGTLLEDLRLLGQYPGRAVLFGIQAAKVEIGTRLSTAVARELPKLVRAALEELDLWTRESNDPSEAGRGDANASTEDEK